jgi:outer membrane lipoprotein-sorting protein
MRRLATFPVRRLWAIAGAVCLLALGAGIAQAALSGSSTPPPAKPLDVAVHDALTAPQVKGLSARITFTNHLLPSSSVNGQGSSPLLNGATGRLWLAADGRARLELQSESGDAQVLSDGKTITVYDPSSNTVYRATLPADKAGAGAGAAEKPPTLADIRKGIDHLAQAWTLSGAEPTSTAGQPSYTVRIAPKDDGGLLGAAEVAWDAARGVPLRAAVYAQGQSDPVLALEATDVSYGDIPASDFAATPPADAKVVEVQPPATHGARGDKAAGKDAVQGVGAVAKQLDFPLAAPADLAGLPRQGVRLVSFEGSNGALVSYGKGMGAILVLQRKAPASAAGKAKSGDRGGVQLPQVNIDGATGQELATALGTVVTFERNGVSYTVAGSVPPVAAENAARGLR